MPITALMANILLLTVIDTNLSCDIRYINVAQLNRKIPIISQLSSRIPIVYTTAGESVGQSLIESFGLPLIQTQWQSV